MKASNLRLRHVSAHKECPGYTLRSLHEAKDFLRRLLCMQPRTLATHAGIHRLARQRKIFALPGAYREVESRNRYDIYRQVMKGLEEEGEFRRRFDEVTAIGTPLNGSALEAQKLGEPEDTYLFSLFGSRRPLDRHIRNNLGLSRSVHSVQIVLDLLHNRRFVRLDLAELDRHFPGLEGFDIFDHGEREPFRTVKVEFGSTVIAASDELSVRAEVVGIDRDRAKLNGSVLAAPLPMPSHWGSKDRRVPAVEFDIRRKVYQPIIEPQLAEAAMAVGSKLVAAYSPLIEG